MKYVTTTRIAGCNSKVVLEPGSAISLSDLPRLGYNNAQHAWDCMIEEGAIEQVTTIEGAGQQAPTDPSLRVWAQTTAPTASWRPPPPEFDPGNTDRSWVRRC